MKTFTMDNLLIKEQHEKNKNIYSVLYKPTKELLCIGTTHDECDSFIEGWNAFATKNNTVLKMQESRIQNILQHCVRNHEDVVCNIGLRDLFQLFIINGCDLFAKFNGTKKVTISIKEIPDLKHSFTKPTDDSLMKLMGGKIPINDNGDPMDMAVLISHG